jgi:hypothetical protein
MFGVKLKERADAIGYKEVGLLITGISRPVQYTTAE